MERDQLAKILRNDLFSRRDSVHSAYQYAEKVISTLRQEDKLGVYTLLHVMMNTIADEIEKVKICNHNWKELKSSQDKEAIIVRCTKCGGVKEVVVSNKR